MAKVPLRIIKIFASCYWSEPASPVRPQRRFSLFVVTPRHGGYLKERPNTQERQIFLVEKRSLQGRADLRPVYCKKDGILCRKMRCAHYLSSARHSMATQLLNANVDLVSIQKILEHTKIKTTQRFSKLSNLNAGRTTSRLWNEFWKNSFLSARMITPRQLYRATRKMARFNNGEYWETGFSYEIRRYNLQSAG